MSYELLKWFHLVSLFFVVGASAALILVGRSRLWSALQGGGLTLGLLAGLGIMHQLKIAWEPWIIGKLICWVLLGMLPSFVRRIGTRSALFATAASVAIAVYLAIFKS